MRESEERHAVPAAVLRDNAQEHGPIPSAVSGAKDLRFGSRIGATSQKSYRV
jgi:hypothetical protein